MQMIRVTLKPVTPFGTPLLGEIFFGQLCWAVHRLYGEDRLVALLDGYADGRPFAVLSDAMPEGFVPLPTPVFVKILQKNWLGVFLSLKNLSRGFAPTLRYPRIFFNMNRRLLVLCFLYYARAVQGGIPMTANVNRNGSVRLRGAISLSG